MDDGGIISSYALVHKKDTLLFLYNDDYRNKYTDSSKNVFSFNRELNESVAALVAVSPDGSIQYEVLFTCQDAGVYLLPRACSQISDNQIFIAGWKGFRDRCGLLTLEGQ